MTVLTEYSQQKLIPSSLILANIAQPVSINPTHLILAANERLYTPWRDAHLVYCIALKSVSSHYISAVVAAIKPKMTPGKLAAASGRSRFSLHRP